MCYVYHTHILYLYRYTHRECIYIQTDTHNINANIYTEIQICMQG